MSEFMSPNSVLSHNIDLSHRSTLEICSSFSVGNGIERVEIV